MNKNTVLGVAAGVGLGLGLAMYLPAIKRKVQELLESPRGVPGKRVVMVTGGTGLVGKGIETVVKDDPEATDNEEWVFLSSQHGNLVDREETEAIFRRFRPTHVIHLAARVGGLFANQKYKVEFYRENVIMNDNVMECCRKFKV